VLASHLVIDTATNALARALAAGVTHTASLLNIYDGPMPSMPEAAPIGSTLLASFALDPATLATPLAFGLDPHMIWLARGGYGGTIATTVITSGAPQWGRFVDRDNNAVADILVGVYVGGFAVPADAELVFTHGPWIGGADVSLFHMVVTHA
jgi:hypothetical protein